MEGINPSHENSRRPDWYDQIDWNAPDVERQISFLYAETTDQFKDRPKFQIVFNRLCVEFAEKHLGAEGDKLFAEWMITRLRREFLGRA